MMKGTRFSALMAVIGLSSIIYGVQLLFSMEGMPPGMYHCICLYCFAPLCFLLNALFLRKEKTVNLTVLANGTFGIILLVLMFCYFGLGGGKQTAATILYCFLIIWFAVRNNLRPPKESHLILLMDISVALSILLLIVMNTMERSWLDILPIGVGCVCILLGLMSFRLHSLRQWTVPCILLVIMMALLSMVMSFAVPIGRFITGIFGGLVAGLKYIGAVIEGFLLYLTTFMKEEHFEEVQAEAFGIPSGAMETAQQFQDRMGIIIGLIILGFFIFVLIMALRILGKSGIGGKKLKSIKHKRNYAPPLFAVIWNWLRELGERIHYFLLVIKRRKTPWGLYHFLIFVTGKGRIKPGETPGEFLFRLSKQLPKTGQELVAVLPEIESALFSRKGNSKALQKADDIIFEVLMKFRLHT